MESKKYKLIETETRFLVARGEGCGMGKMGEGVQKAQLPVIR